MYFVSSWMCGTHYIIPDKIINRHRIEDIISVSVTCILTFLMVSFHSLIYNFIIFLGSVYCILQNTFFCFIIIQIFSCAFFFKPYYVTFTLRSVIYLKLFCTYIKSRSKDLFLFTWTSIWLLLLTKKSVHFTSHCIVPFAINSIVTF